MTCRRTCELRSLDGERCVPTGRVAVGTGMCVAMPDSTRALAHPGRLFVVTGAPSRASRLVGATFIDAAAWHEPDAYGTRRRTRVPSEPSQYSLQGNSLLG